MPDQNLFGSQISDDAAATLVTGTVFPVLTPSGSVFVNEKTLLSSLAAALQSLGLLVPLLLDGVANLVQLTVQGHSTQTTPIATIEKSDGTDLFNFLNSGVLQIPLAHNAGADATGATAAVASGTYTPTITNITNIDASTAYLAQWMRVGKVVTVSGKVDIDATAAGATTFGISLPIASNFTAGQHCAGCAITYAPGISSSPGTVLADMTNDRAGVDIMAVDGANRPVVFQFTYTVL